MRNRLTLTQYHEIGGLHQLKYLEDHAQKRMTVPARWECLRCGRTHLKSYKAIKYYPNPCICWSGRTLNVKDYEDLAFSLTKHFKTPVIFSKLNNVPQNVDQEVIWELPKQEFSFVCSYYRMKYHGIHSKIIDLIETVKENGDAAYSDTI